MDDPDSASIKNKGTETLKMLGNLPPIPPLDWRRPYNIFQELNKNVQEKCKQHELIIDQLNETHKTLELSLSDMDLNEKDHKKSLNEGLERKKEIKREMTQLSNKINVTEEKLKHLQNGDEKLEFTADVLKVKKQNELLVSLFRIKWDETTPENQVTGYVVKPTTSEICPFALDRDTNSQHFITNYLWDQLKDSRSPFMEETHSSIPASDS